MSAVKSIERIVSREGKVITVTSDADIITAARQMHMSDIGSLVVVDESGKVIGIVTERDILGKVVACAANPARIRVASIMSKTVVACSPGTSITEARQIMARHHIRHLPLVEDGAPVGMISSRDVMAHELATTKAVAHRQSKLLAELEERYPGITRLRTDAAGRVVI